MFERYTVKARLVILFSRSEAARLGALAIKAEYILLGLMREDKRLMDRFLPQEAITAIKKKIEEQVVPSQKASPRLELPLTAEAKRVLQYAAEESELLGHRYIGTEHLLLGLLREQTTVAADLLQGEGLELQHVREQLMHAPHTEAAQASTTLREVARAIHKRVLGSDPLE